MPLFELQRNWKNSIPICRISTYRALNVKIQGVKQTELKFWL